MSENMRERFNYTQRPENPRLFLASEMANALEVTLPTFYTLARKLDLDNIKKPGGRATKKTATKSSHGRGNTTRHTRSTGRRLPGRDI